ncbi:TatD family hydrolase [Pigmentibacter sp. JX0631]|uniref:TatD family hydrolase n=1 Tax=Pigmentibacter sp. JX0631 TaxID=2976982 RepID=UPI00246911D5|nr:TatD family hydrolase [Pigmentibacter sp. JX0631]WGL59080.1 TatD family hydrolase [Pigmentibacter sp. JX0631]
MLIDTHCHLVSNKLKDNLNQILQQAKDNGLEKIINIAYDPETIQLGLEQLHFSEMIYLTLGIQPHDAAKFTIPDAEIVRSHAKSNKRVVGIGEIGLDAYYTLSPMEKQIECFEYFLAMATELKLPVVVHVRETHSLVLDRIKQFLSKGLTGVIHCFTGTLTEAKEFLDCGFYLSFSGIVTFKNSTSLQEVAKIVPENKILIETDSPYLAPVPMRGKINEPGNLKYTCDFIANLRNISSQDLANLTKQNAETLFFRLKEKS